VDYELSSWKYQKDSELSPYAKYITGELPLPENSGIIIKRGYIIPTAKGMDSAYGGKWQPSPHKPKDARYLGNPGEIKRAEMDNGEIFITKIGDDGRAEMERHNTDHGKPWAHTNPHDHQINWVDPPGYPDPQPPINYPNGAPEFKSQGATNTMKNAKNHSEGNRFITISDFKFCMKCHGETEFVWNGITYSITHYDGDIAISHSRQHSTEMRRKTADEILEYMVGEDRLRDIITQVKVLYRTV